MKLFRVTVERSERAVVYVQATDSINAESAAIKAAGDLESDYWDGAGFSIVGVRTIDDAQRAKIERREAGYQHDGEAYVENGEPCGITVNEWLAGGAGIKEPGGLSRAFLGEDQQGQPEEGK